MILAMDVDNVIYPYSTVMARWTERRKGLAPGTLDDVALSWTWYRDQWGISGEEFMEHFRTGIEAGFIYVEGCPSEGSVSTLRRLANAGHQIVYVTDRAIPGIDEWVAYDRTADWLNQHGFPEPANVVITGRKHEVESDVLLDDKPENVYAAHEAGHPLPLLWDRPHNRRAGALFRVHSWHGYERIINGLTVDQRRAA